jgi:murein DD-endopeptidase MepM/ murein hydrolase activator NlpD
MMRGMGSPPRIAASLLVCALSLVAAAGLRAEGGDYALVRSLSSDDLLFRQITGDVEAYRNAGARGGRDAVKPALMVFRYRPGPADDLSAVAARLNITQATLVTLNRVSSPAGFRALKEVLIANAPGVFVPDRPTSELEQTLAASRAGRSRNATPVVLNLPGARVTGRFYPGEDFTAGELSRFYRGFFRSPLVSGWISSGYGSRARPFGGGSGFHGGIDIVAPKGTPVMAAQGGQIAEIGSSGQYGNYVVIAHDAVYQTLYAHLKSVAVGLRDRVESGTIIGTVGDTGLTTGPHLHFEIHYRGSTVDPLAYLPAIWGRR